MRQTLLRTEPIFDSELMHMVENELNSSFWKTMNMFSPNLGRWVPTVDIVENENSIIFSIDVAGIPQEDIDVEYEDGYLVISGKRESLLDRDYAKSPDAVIHRHEIRHGEFTRSFRLPEGTSADDIVAKHDRGMLWVTVKKPSTVHPPGHKIPITGGEPLKETVSQETASESIGSKEKISLSE